MNPAAVFTVLPVVKVPTVRWFGGCVTHASDGAEYLPGKGVSLLWTAPFPVWTAETWPSAEVRCAHSGGRAAAVIGVSSASTHELKAWLADNRANPPPWPGTYTVVVRDAAGVRVFTDPVHAAPVYYVDTGDAVVWASSSRALAPLGAGGPDLEWLASTLCHPTGLSLGRRSAFAGISCVPPGHCLALSQGQQPTVRPWWHPPEAVPAKDAAAGLRTALTRAVAAHLTSAAHVSCDMSGGLDSTSVTLLAAENAAPEQQVTALTVRPDSMEHGGDLDYARAVAQGRTNLPHLVIGLPDEALPFAELEETGPSDEPAPTTITTARHRRAYEHLAHAHSQRHLTGDGGDALLIPPPVYLRDLLRRGRFLRVVRDVHGWAKLSETSPWPRARELLKRAPPTEDPPAWCTQRSRQLAARQQETAPPPAACATDTHVIADVRTVARTARADGQAAERFGIRLEAPFLDRSVVEAALRFGVADRGSPWSYKPQITGAFSDLLPRSVLARRTKGGTDPDHHRGLRVHLQDVKHLMRGWLADQGLIHPGRLDAALDAAAAGMPARFGEIEPAVAAEAWARAVTTAPAVRWTRRLLTGAEET